jgi:uncharacterized membrane protein YqjE
MANEAADSSIKELITSVTADAKKLAQAQAELAKLEIDKTKQQAGAMGGMFAAAAVLGALGGLFLLITIAYVLVALGLPVWAGFGIVTLVLLLVAGILAAVGKSKADKMKGGLPATKLELERTKRMLTGSPTETSPAVRANATVSTKKN